MFFRFRFFSSLLFIFRWIIRSVSAHLSHLNFCSFEIGRRQFFFTVRQNERLYSNTLKQNVFEFQCQKSFIKYFISMVLNQVRKTCLFLACLSLTITLTSTENQMRCTWTLCYENPFIPIINQFVAARKVAICASLSMLSNNFLNMIVANSRTQL